MPHYAAKRDSNEKEIIQALTGIGAAVQKLSIPGHADLVVGFRGNTYLIECKTKRGKLTPTQIEMRAIWGDYIEIARDVETALRIVGAID